MASEGRSPSAARPPGGQAPVRAAEVIGAMSMATDLGTGQPLEHALRTAILAVRLGELAGLSPPELVDAYYISLLHSIGCTSDMASVIRAGKARPAPRPSSSITGRMSPR